MHNILTCVMFYKIRTASKLLMIMNTRIIQFNSFIKVPDNGLCPIMSKHYKNNQHMLTNMGKQQINNENDDDN
jgi:hypothetical protein